MPNKASSGSGGFGNIFGLIGLVGVIEVAIKLTKKQKVRPSEVVCAALVVVKFLDL